MTRTPTKRAELGRRIEERREDDSEANIDDIVVSLYKEALRNTPYEKGWILLGFPPKLTAIRTLEENESMQIQ